MSVTSSSEQLRSIGRHRTIACFPQKQVWPTQMFPDPLEISNLCWCSSSGHLKQTGHQLPEHPWPLLQTILQLHKNLCPWHVLSDAGMFWAADDEQFLLVVGRTIPGLMSICATDGHRRGSRNSYKRDLARLQKAYNKHFLYTSLCQANLIFSLGCRIPKELKSRYLLGASRTTIIFFFFKK